MSTTKWIKSITALFVLLAALLAGCSAKTKLENIRTVADKIAGYRLPEGYSEQFAVDAMGYQIAGMEGPTPNCHIYLVQAPKDIELDVAKLKEQARELEGNRSRNGKDSRDVQIVETRMATVRGQEVPVVVGEGVNSENQPYREITTLFEGRSGPALVSISSPADLWNWDLVNEFLASIE